MKNTEIALMLGLLTLLSACSLSNSYNESFKDPLALRKSRLAVEEILPRDFIAIIPSTARQINVYHEGSDTITYLRMELSQSPNAFFGLITKMEHSKIHEVTSLRPLQPKGIEWWDRARFQECLNEDLFVFRKLPVEDPNSVVYAAVTKTGEVYAWVLK